MMVSSKTQIKYTNFQGTALTNPNLLYFIKVESNIIVRDSKIISSRRRIVWISKACKHNKFTEPYIIGMGVHLTELSGHLLANTKLSMKKLYDPISIYAFA